MSLSNSIDLRRSAGLTIAPFFRFHGLWKGAKHTPGRKAWKLWPFSSLPIDNLAIDRVEIVNQWQRRKMTQQRQTRGNVCARVEDKK